MTCDQAREALSAWSDAEPATASGEWVDRHLAGCRECRGWLIAAERLNRRLRVRSGVTAPDLTARILAAADPTSAPGPTAPGSTSADGGVVDP